MSFNTGNPLGSKDILDLYDNSEVVDQFVNSQQDEIPDRFGTKRLTLAGLIKRSMALRNEINDFSGAMTFKPEWTDVPMNVSEGVGGEGGALNLQAEALGNRSEINKITSREALRRTYLEAGLNLVSGSFEAGGTLVNANDVLLHEADGTAYNWDGVFPGGGKAVPPGATPASTGGVVGGAWRPVGDITLREELASPGGSNTVGFQQEGDGSVPRTAQDKMRECVTPQDFDAFADGVTLDDAAFTKLETTYLGMEIDCLGKQYAVTAAPIGNKYYNGEWIVGGNVSRMRWEGAQHTGAGRFAFGDGALASIPDSYSMGETATVVAVGYKALNKTTQVKKSIAIGTSAMEKTLISRDNIAIGDSALKNIQSRTPDYSQTYFQGTRMVALGGNAGYFAVDAYNMVIAGRNAGHCVEGGYGLVAIGAGAVTGYAVIGLSGEIENNAPWGVDGQVIRTAAVGLNTLGSNLAVANAAVGGEALYHNKRSNNNSAFGVRALYSLDINTGHNGGANVTKDIAGTYSHTGNVLTLNFTAHGAVVGDKVQIRLLDGGSQTFLGDQPIATVVSVISPDSFTVNHPISRTASGNAHLYSLETAAQMPRNENNSAVGAAAGGLITTGAYVTLHGYNAAGAATTANRATIMGGRTATAALSIVNSVAIGTFAADNMVSLTNVTALGDGALRFKVDGTDLVEAWSNVTGVGSNARVSGANQTQLGDVNSNVYSQSAIQIRSDERDKADKRVIDGDTAVAFVRGLVPYLYKYDFRDDYFEEYDIQTGIDPETAEPVFTTKLLPIPKDGSKKRNRDHAGYLAQQVKELMDRLGIDFGMYQDHLVNDGCDVKTLAYEQTIPFVTKALDVAFTRLDELEKRIAALE